MIGRPKSWGSSLVLAALVAAPLVGGRGSDGQAWAAEPSSVAVPSSYARVPQAVSASSGFVASLGLTRSQVEERFHEIDGTKTVFKMAKAVRGVPRVLGSDKGLYTVVEVNGYPEVVNVQVATLLSTASKTELENQVAYDSLACGLLADEAAQDWCTGRILNTNRRGLVDASKAKDFGPVRITVRTYQSSKASNPPVVSINVSPA